ncbi:MAG: Hpt domain-containing protein [Clostridiales bacterium]|jgi:HPt (histidine-containing phosphotransfer) domain-containing protein|nr:Hpt domain-containing protein [Clostridiales bacterium]
MQEDFKNYFDFQDALGRLGGNKNLYIKMIGFFFNGKEFAGLEQAVAENDLVQAEKFAHALKGVAGNLAMTAIYEGSAALMQQFRRGENDAAAFAAFRADYIKTQTLAPAAIEALSRG